MANLLEFARKSWLRSFVGVILILPLLGTLVPHEVVALDQNQSPNTQSPDSGVIRPVVGTLTAINVTSDSATLQGNLIDLGSAKAVQVLFVYGLNSTYGKQTKLLNMQTAGPQ